MPGFNFRKRFTSYKDVNLFFLVCVSGQKAPSWINESWELFLFRKSDFWDFFFDEWETHGFSLL
jgi:hypothetical protein